MNAGIAMAHEEIDPGRALEKLKALQNYRLSGEIRDRITDETATAN